MGLTYPAPRKAKRPETPNAQAVYLDFAATAPMRPQVREGLLRLLEEPLGNASSLHQHGHRARMILEQAREDIASLLKAEVEEIIFTSGATEANNLAVLGWMRQQPKGSRVLISAVEHPSVWEAAEALTFEGYGVDVVPVDRQGRVQSDLLASLIQPQTSLISVMAVNNEVGALQPLEELKAHKRHCKLHVDAVQSGWVGWPELTGVDMLSLSAHKLGGPVGSGCLYLRQGLKLAPLLLGGSQEDHRRAGTSHVFAALGLALAMQISAQRRAQEHLQLVEQQQRLRQGILARIPRAQALVAEGSPHISSWVFEGVLAEPLLVLLDLEGISASSGSACSSHSLEPSRVVSAMGYSPAQARGLIRFSLGYATTSQEIEQLLATLPGLVERVRQRSASSAPPGKAKVGPVD